MKYKNELLKSAKSSFFTILGVVIGTLLIRYFLNSECHGLPESILYLSLFVLAFIISTVLSTLIEIHKINKKSRKKHVKATNIKPKVIYDDKYRNDFTKNHVEDMWDKLK